MPAKKRQITGLLRKTIDLNEAPARGLRAALAEPPDASDLLAYAREQLAARWAELDEFFGLNSNAADIWTQRAKALIAREFAIRADDPQWWGRLALHLAVTHMPGFSFRQTGKNKYGAPRQWSDEQRAQLFADVENLKRTGMSVRQICQSLPKRPGYVKRWGYYRAAGLRKAYLQAKRRSRGLLFQLILCGPEATIPGSRVDPIEAAIRLHAIEAPF